MTESPTVVIIKGSRSDRNFCQKLGEYLQTNGIAVIHRTGSAHRTPGHVLNIVNSYNTNPNIVGYVSSAGLSDALSGAIAANTEKPVIAYPPDLEKYGELKVFSSTKLPTGIKVSLARTPEEVLKLIRESSAQVYSQKELNSRRMKIAETFFTDNQELGLAPALGLPLFKKGKTRDVYDLGNKLLINSMDRISAFDVNSVTEIAGKGTSLNQFSVFWFEQTKDIFPNHFISVPDLPMMLVRKAERVNIEWVIRGRMYGSMYRAYAKGERNLYGYELPNGLQLAEELPQVMLTPTTKAEVGHDMPITKQQAIDMGLLTPAEWNELEEASFQLYEYYTTVAGQKGFIIPDFKLEFGRYQGRFIHIDEPPNHDSARLWIEKYYKVGQRQEAWCADKEFYRQFLIDSGIDSSNPPIPLPEIPEPVVVEIQKRLGVYNGGLGLHEIFLGKRSIDSLELRSLEEVEKELGMLK
jgi:phosphoribosylaminoimidazole-succinocarboxamide synthase